MNTQTQNGNGQSIIRQPQTAIAPSGAGSWMTPPTFQDAWRIARGMATSPMVPEHLRARSGNPDETAATVFTCMAMAQGIGVNPVVLMQQTFSIGGKIGFAAKFLVALANRSGKFIGPIRYDVKGAGDSMAVTAFATLAATGEELRGETITMELARGEGWTKNAKYKTRPQMMLQYRAGTAFVNAYCPEIFIDAGIPSTSVEELEDEIASHDPIDVTPQPAPANALERAREAGAKALAEKQAAEVVETPAPQPQADPTPKRTATPAPTRSPEDELRAQATQAGETAWQDGAPREAVRAILEGPGVLTEKAINAWLKTWFGE